jgi:hypothetical protein
MLLKYFDQSVNVIGHDAPRQQPIALAVEVQKGGLDKGRDIPSSEPAGTKARIQFAIDLGGRA